MREWFAYDHSIYYITENILVTLDCFVVSLVVVVPELLLKMFNNILVQLKGPAEDIGFDGRI